MNAVFVRAPRPFPSRGAARTVAAGGALIGALVLMLVPPAAMAADLDFRVVGGDGAPLADAVLFLESPAAQAAVKPLPHAEVGQIDKRFEPGVSVVTVGTPVSFPNRDSVRHHVYSFSPAKRFEIKLYVGTPASPVVFDRPGISVLGCNIHDQMVAWLVIVASPWYVKTDARGLARLTDVASGSYRLRSWHASLPPGELPADQPLRVEALGDASAARIDVVLAAAKP